MRIVFLLIVFLCTAAWSLRAEVIVSMTRADADSVVVFKFKSQSKVFMPVVFGNEKAMAQLRAWSERYRGEIEAGKCRFSVESFCRDFEDEEQNKETARLRSIYVKGYLIQQLNLKEKNFMTRNLPVDSYYESRQGGVALKKEMPEDYLAQSAARENVPERSVMRDTIVVRDTVVKEVIREVFVEAEPEVREVIREVEKPVVVYGRLRVKTNLVDWLLLTPNAEVEYMLSDRWGVNGEVRWTHWNWDDDSRTYRLALGSAELRYYFRSDTRLDGVFAGVYYQGGKFNYKLGDTGYQGTLHGGGLSLGYVKPLTDSWYLEFSAGFGFSHRNYDTYVWESGKDVNTDTGIRNGWGVAKAKVSVGYSLFGRKK